MWIRKALYHLPLFVKTCDASWQRHQMWPFGHGNIGWWCRYLHWNRTSCIFKSWFMLNLNSIEVNFYVIKKQVYTLHFESFEIWASRDKFLNVQKKLGRMFEKNNVVGRLHLTRLFCNKEERSSFLHLQLPLAASLYLIIIMTVESHSFIYYWSWWIIKSFLVFIFIDVVVFKKFFKLHPHTNCIYSYQQTSK